MWAAVWFAPATAWGVEERPVLFSLALDDTPLERCGGSAALAGAVEERLQRPAFTSAASADIAFAIHASQRGVETSWSAEIVEHDRSGVELGRRDVPLPTADCVKARDTLAVVLAIMIGPARTTTDPPWEAEPMPSPELVAPTPPPPLPTPPADRRPTPKGGTPPEPLRWRVSSLAGFAVGSGVLPGAAWGAEIGVLVRPPIRRLSILGRASYWPDRTTPTQPPAEIDRIGGALLGCYDLVRSGSFLTMGCAGADLSRIHARSADLTRSSESSALLAVLGEVRFGYRVVVGDSIALEPFIAPQISVLFVRDRYTYRDPTGRERILLLPAPIAFQGGFGVAVHFL
jgi:hypothetical protein